jgi:hypothetical protein
MDSKEEFQHRPCLACLCVLWLLVVTLVVLADIYGPSSIPAMVWVVLVVLHGLFLCIGVFACVLFLLDIRLRRRVAKRTREEWAVPLEDLVDHDF